jgi:putative molybdopterin biosynthesis protein
VALDRVTIAPVRARWPSPRHDCAAMDGIAVAAPAQAVARGAGGGWRLPGWPAAWVDTGNPLPEGTDTVIARERVRLTADGSPQIRGPVPSGLNVRTAGEDFGAGELLIPAGHRLRPVDLAAAAAAGHATVEVARQPVVAIIPTGNELQPPGSPPRPGGVTDSNSVLLAARATQAGARPVVCDPQPDDENAIAAGVRRAALGADVVLILAGTSAGRGDHTAGVITRVGGLAVRGVAVRPGHPALLGYVLPEQAAKVPARSGQPAAVVPVIGVPGYPLAAALIFELFALPLLAWLQGVGCPAQSPLPSAHVPDRAGLRARLDRSWISPPDVEDWVLVSLAVPPAGRDGDGLLVATPAGRGAGAISRLLRADAWWPVPVGQGDFARGDLIWVQPLPGTARSDTAGSDTAGSDTAGSDSAGSDSAG